MIETKTDWVDGDKVPAADFNRIESNIKELSTLTTTFIDFTAGSGSGVVCRVGFTCQMDVTLTSASLSAPLFTMPQDFSPAINFDTPVINTETGMVVGYLAFDKTQNTVVFNGTSATFANPCRVTVTYLCD